MHELSPFALRVVAFFFQAEDGIRYKLVTGVQTCALPIFRGGGEVGSAPARFSTLNSNNRWTWWKEAWRVFEDKPLGGKGAATFELARRRVRGSDVPTNEPHNIALQALSETGIVGFLLGTA